MCFLCAVCFQLATLEELMKAVQPDQEATKEQLHMLARGAMTELLSRGGGGGARAPPGCFFFLLLFTSQDVSLRKMHFHPKNKK